MLDICFDSARHMFRLCLAYVSTVLDLCFDRARPSLRFSVDQNWVCFDFMLHLKLLLDRGFSVAKESPNINQAPRPGKSQLFYGTKNTPRKFVFDKRKFVSFYNYNNFGEQLQFGTLGI